MHGMALTIIDVKGHINFEIFIFADTSHSFPEVYIFRSFIVLQE